MACRSVLLSLVVLVLLPLSVAAAANPVGPPQGPLADRASAVSVHAPFEAGACGLCHASDNPASPGALRGEVNAICFSCHTDVQEAMAGARVTHRAAVERCTRCHNAHDSRLPKLLTASLPELCYACHAEVKKVATTSAVRHDAVEKGRSCLACHSPHAAKVEKLLAGLPYDLCVNCHSGQSPVDREGKPLTNFGQLLAQNRFPHGPVAARDCSACHVPHGSEHFRLLVADYPSAFYAPFTPANYELCFSCHNEQVVMVADTDSLTGFRDGSRNLHFLHVNKSERGRTCRACHEVHAAPQDHLVRDSVPYGTGGWMLSINFHSTATGGTCEKTCHAAKSYDRKARPAAPAAGTTSR